MSRSWATPRIGRLHALARYYRDPSASVLGKALAFLALAYVIMPVDLIPDVPFVGWLDDIGVMGLATAWLARVVSKYREAEALPQKVASDRNELDERASPATSHEFVVHPGRS